MVPCLWWSDSQVIHGTPQLRESGPVSCHRSSELTDHGGRRPAGSIVAMPELKQKLRTDLATSMKARDVVRTRTLRMALTAITNEEVAGAAARELSDDEVVKLLVREAKKRREAAQAFEAGGRQEKADAERAEAEVIAGYLPAQLADDELASVVATAIRQTGATGPQAMG